MRQQAGSATPVAIRTKALVCTGGLPVPVTEAIVEALKAAGCTAVETVDDLDSVLRFDCSQAGCPRWVDARLENTSLIVLDQEMAGVSGFEVLGVLRGLPETQQAKVIMFGPHGPHDHRSVLAAWGLHVDCYLTRNDFLSETTSAVEKLQRYAGMLLTSPG